MRLSSFSSPSIVLILAIGRQFRANWVGLNPAFGVVFSGAKISVSARHKVLGGDIDVGNAQNSPTRMNRARP